MRASTAALTATALATVTSAQLMSDGVPTTPLEIGQEIIGNLSSTCKAALLEAITPTSAIGECLSVSGLIPIATSNTSIVEPLDAYITSQCAMNPCSNETIANFTTSILDGCSSDLEEWAIDPEYIEFAMSQYPLVREILCLNTTTPEANEELFQNNSTSSMVSSSASLSTATSAVASSAAASIATAPAVSAASAAASLAGRQLASSAVSAVSGASSAVAPSVISASASAASSSVVASASATSGAAAPSSTAAVNETTSCPISILTQVEQVLGANLTLSYIIDVATGGNNTVFNEILSIPKSALCDDCIFGAVDLFAESWPAVVNLTIAQNYTVASFLNETCEATVAPYNVTYDGVLPETINATAANSTFAYNITSLGNNQTTNETAPTGLPNIPVFDKLNNATSTTVSASSAESAATQTSAGVVSSASAAVTSVVSAVPTPSVALSSAAGAASAIVSNPAAIKARWLGQI